MEIACESCQAKLIIPNEKLPAGQRVAVKCPKCGNRIVVETPPAGPEPFGVPERPDEQATRETEIRQGDEPSGLDDTEAEKALDSYGEGEKLALIMVQEGHPVEGIREALGRLEYIGIQAGNTREALSKLRVQHFDLMILADPFDNIPLIQSPILQYLNHLSMSVRRRMFVIAMGDAFRTMDHMTAYAMSVNLVANWKDLGKFSNILRRAIQDHEAFYKVFMDTLKETGKA